MLLKKIYEIGAERMIEDIEEFLKNQKKVLDLGCGSGVLAHKISKLFQVELLCLDIKDRRIFPVPFQKYDGRHILFPDKYFDLVLICFVLHHTQDPIAILKEAKRVGKKIIIFEDLPENFIGKLRCFLHLLFWNLFSFWKMKFNFFSENEWEEIFQKLNLKLLMKKDFRPPFFFLDPVKKKVFVLKT